MCRDTERMATIEQQLDSLQILPSNTSSSIDHDTAGEYYDNPNPGCMNSLVNTNSPTNSELLEGISISMECCQDPINREICKENKCELVEDQQQQQVQQPLVTERRGEKEEKYENQMVNHCYSEACSSLPSSQQQNEKTEQCEQDIQQEIQQDIQHEIQQDIQHEIQQPCSSSSGLQRILSQLDHELILHQHGQTSPITSVTTFTREHSVRNEFKSPTILTSIQQQQQPSPLNFLSKLPISHLVFTYIDNHGCAVRSIITTHARILMRRIPFVY